MRRKKISIISVLLLLLTIITIIIAYNCIGPGAADVKACKDFVNKLYMAKGITESESTNKLLFKRQEKAVNESELAEKSIITKYYAVDLNKDNQVIGYIKKNVSKIKITKISMEEAEKLSKKYLSSIYSKDVVLREEEYNEEDNYLPYYSFIYTREEDGYPFYCDEIKLNIDKEDGMLDGYSNSTLQKKYKKSSINIEQSRAEEYASHFFLKYNQSCLVKKEDTELVYGVNTLEKNSENVCELCYMIVLSGKDLNNKDQTWKVFVSAENGKIINSLKDDSEKNVEIQ